MTIRGHEMLTLQANSLIVRCPLISLYPFLQDSLHSFCVPFCLSHFHTYYIFTALIHFLPQLHSRSFHSAGNGFYGIANGICKFMSVWYILRQCFSVVLSWACVCLWWLVVQSLKIMPPCNTAAPVSNPCAVSFYVWGSQAFRRCCIGFCFL